MKALWGPMVQLQPNPLTKVSEPVLTGRLYLFDTDVKHPLACEGSLVVDLYDVTSGQEVMLEEWRLDSETLKRLLRKDLIGWGYSLALPWTTSRPGVTTVVLKARFDRGPDPSGGSLIDLGAPMKLTYPDRPAQVAPPLPQCKPGPRASS
jgi:hypothetical protein